MEVKGQLHATVALPTDERASGTHWVECWVVARSFGIVIPRILLGILTLS